MGSTPSKPLEKGISSDMFSSPATATATNQNNTLTATPPSTIVTTAKTHSVKGGSIATTATATATTSSPQRRPSKKKAKRKPLTKDLIGLPTNFQVY